MFRELSLDMELQLVTENDQVLTAHHVNRRLQDGLLQEKSISITGRILFRISLLSVDVVSLHAVAHSRGIVMSALQLVASHKSAVAPE